jgi:hypothetical protein
MAALTVVAAFVHTILAKLVIAAVETGVKHDIVPGIRTF